MGWRYRVNCVGAQTLHERFNVTDKDKRDEARRTKARARVLVADDEPSARSGLATLLRDEGFEVTLAGHPLPA